MEAAETPQSSPPMSAAMRSHWERLYVAHHEVIWRTLRRMGYGADAAAEATQNAFLISLQRWHDVRPGKEKSFLFSTAILGAKTAARKNRRLELGDEPDLPDAGVAARHLDRRQQALEILDRILAEMDEELVVIFALYEIEEWTSPEIAEILDIPLGTVASRLRRARERFQALATRLDSTPGSSGATATQQRKGALWTR
jgi:RNA polymerase sigma-70 factor, ECF subfamily